MQKTGTAEQNTNTVKYTEKPEIESEILQYVDQTEMEIKDLDNDKIGWTSDEETELSKADLALMHYGRK